MKNNFLLNIFLLCTALFLITTFVVGYNSGVSPSVMGHTGDEIIVTINGQQSSLNPTIENMYNYLFDLIWNKKPIGCGWSGWFGTGIVCVNVPSSGIGVCMLSQHPACDTWGIQQIKCDDGVLRIQPCCLHWSCISG